MRALEVLPRANLATPAKAQCEGQTFKAPPQSVPACMGAKKLWGQPAIPAASGRKGCPSGLGRSAAQARSPPPSPLLHSGPVFHPAPESPQGSTTGPCWEAWPAGLARSAGQKQHRSGRLDACCHGLTAAALSSPTRTYVWWCSSLLGAPECHNPNTCRGRSQGGGQGCERDACDPGAVACSAQKKHMRLTNTWLLWVAAHWPWGCGGCGSVAARL